MTKDRIYRTAQQPIPPFEFNAAVVNVFDDMIHRSVPMYAEIIRQQARLVQRSYQPGTRIYDLGCSNGNLALSVCAGMPPGSFRMVAVDSSQPMLDAFDKRMAEWPQRADIRLTCSDIRDVALAQASVVVVNFTLQFIPPTDRSRLVQRIYDALVPGGMLLFSEKTVHPDAGLADLQVEYYYRFKRENGYSELEISQKREALENVLVPETVAQHHDRLTGCGFSAIDVWLKWFNFCSWICIK
ncbi:carboxy-S-adenosyl-L-methionine synthase [Desulfosarcina ovata subsp. sediminis]|uniref:Carboxy-S-adenosyl-L-methionine synthase n=1 Tax=Desulfosarcina ovata subsp. sediminis TaxID=885957 RepID=A0A5K7ZW72_9BACT|nr:carboxy-S-adenosyl-L-methionine synthase CmoA [Desulfosarcina ovata]BBO84361.1 carboxy-S-adenosyl-L-methionine synthase [Desulfosarcina ovata subsp. sediminis]